MSFFLSVLLCFAPLRFANHHSKRKTGKKKADKQSGESGNTKRKRNKSRKVKEKKLHSAKPNFFSFIMPNAFGFPLSCTRNTLAAFLPGSHWKMILSFYTISEMRMEIFVINAERLNNLNESKWMAEWNIAL